MLTLRGKALLFDNLKNKIKDQNINKITYMAIGTGNARPTQFDTELQKKFATSKANVEVDLAQSCIIAKAEFSTSGIKESISEVGLLTEKKTLVSRDLIEKETIIKEGILEVVYKITLVHDVCINEWDVHSGNVFVASVPEKAYNVYEDNGNGYERKGSISEVQNRTSSYYQSGGKLYIHKSDEFKEGDHIYVRLDELNTMSRSSPEFYKDVIDDYKPPLVSDASILSSYDEVKGIQSWLDSCEENEILSLNQDEIYEDDILTVRKSCVLYGNGPADEYTQLNIKGICIPPRQGKPISLRLQNIGIGEYYFDNTVYVNNGIHDMFIPELKGGK